MLKKINARMVTNCNAVTGFVKLQISQTFALDTGWPLSKESELVYGEPFSFSFFGLKCQILVKTKRENKEGSTFLLWLLRSMHHFEQEAITQNSALDCYDFY